MIFLLFILALLNMQIQNECNANELGLKNIGRWAGVVPNASLPNEVTWKLTLYSSEAYPDMLVAYVIINRSYTIRSKVAAHPVALPGKKNGEWMEFVFPNSKEKFKARKLSNNSLEIIEETSGSHETFSLSNSNQGSELVIYGEICQEWKRSLKEGKWSQKLWQE